MTLTLAILSVIMILLLPTLLLWMWNEEDPR
jgi:hypothetical protein